MACAIWGEKYNFNSLQINGISCVCSTLVNEEQDFSIFCTFFGDPIEQETLHKQIKSSMNWNLLCIWWGAFTFLKQLGLLYLPVASGGNFLCAIIVAT
jgi:hypothetical protein